MSDVPRHLPGVDLTCSFLSDPTPVEAPRGKTQLSSFSQAPLIRWVLTLSFLVATVAMGLYAI
jgi:heme oxygenase